MNLAADPRSVELSGGITEAREADLRGAPGAAVAVEPDGVLRLELGPSEIRTIQLRRRELHVAKADVLDAAGPRQNA